MRVGVAGWSLPTAVQDRFPPGGSHLERYAGRFNAAEINSSFHRPHRRATYARWAAQVPPDFRFAVKLPKTITHQRRLVDCADLIDRFAEEADGLGERRGPLLVQLPPSFVYAGDVAEAFFERLALAMAGPVVCEPRHSSWFAANADAALTRHRIARVAADPAIVPEAARPGGWTGMAYFRLHGAPQIYRSGYDAAAIADQAHAARSAASNGADVWTIFDNTAGGAAPVDALALLEVSGDETRRERRGH